MSEVRPPKDDEIDLFELFELLWRSKWLISAFVAISFLFASSFVIIKSPVYESKMVFSVETKPPYYTFKSIKTEFKALFYSKNIFDLWKSENRTSELVYNDFGIIQVINGYKFVKEEQDLFAYIIEDKKELFSTLVVQTNKLSLLNEFFKYINFVNNKLTSNHVLRAKEELKIIETRFDDGAQNISTTEPPELILNRFIISAQRNSKVIAIKPPTFPKKISPKISIILALSIVLGGMIGVVFVYVNTNIRKRKERVSKI